MKMPYVAKSSSKATSKRGIHGMNVGSQMGAPKMGDMQTPAKLHSTRKVSGKRR